MLSTENYKTQMKEHKAISSKAKLETKNESTK